MEKKSIRYLSMHLSPVQTVMAPKALVVVHSVIMSLSAPEVPKLGGVTNWTYNQPPMIYARHGASSEVWLFHMSCEQHSMA